MNYIECCNISKYKCPICRQPYCSVACYKKHKESPCQSPPTHLALEENQPPVEYEFPSEDTLPQEKLKLLENSMELRQCLQNPHLRKMLEILDKSPYPDSIIQDYMQEPIFTEFVDECLKIVQPPEEYD